MPVACGDFGLAENIAYVLAMMQAIGPDVHVVGSPQGTVSALAATALLSVIDAAASPQSLTLIAGPIDPLANQPVWRPHGLTVRNGSSAMWCAPWETAFRALDARFTQPVRN